MTDSWKTGDDEMLVTNIKYTVQQKWPIYIKKVIPGYTRWDTSWPGGDLWGCTEGILEAVEGIDRWSWARGNWWCTKGRGGVERSSKGRRRVHGWSWCWAPNSRRTARDCSCCRMWPALRGRAARMIWVNATDITKRWILLYSWGSVVSFNDSFYV